ncbi:MAG: hypothetical protein Kow0059_10890 [Candidatus Sumerlaeia bacterium]
MPIRLTNPHSILAVLERRPQDIHWIAVPRGGGSHAWKRAAERAIELSIRVLSSETELTGATRAAGPAGKGKGRAAPKSGREGGGVAEVRERSPVSLEELFRGAEAGGEEPAGTYGLWLALDCVQDPHNLGAIFRTAAFFGVRGIVLPADRTAPLNDTVYDVASGGVEFVPFAVTPNLRRALDEARKSGLWVLGSSEHAEIDLNAVDRDRPWILVLGNEELGLRRLTQDACDVICRITPRGAVGSLNVSVAAGIFMAALTGGRIFEKASSHDKF